MKSSIFPEKLPGGIPLFKCQRPVPVFAAIFMTLISALALVANAQVAAPHGGRFSRGTEPFGGGSYWNEKMADYQAFVIGLNFQRGAGLDAEGDNGGHFPNGPWFTKVAREPRYLFDAAAFAPKSAPESDPSDWTPQWSIRADNPLVAYGTTSGGSPLYEGQQYSFGIYAGGMGVTGNYPAGKAVLRILYYRKSDFTDNAENVEPAGQQVIELPRLGEPADSAEWEEFAANGYSKTITANGLKTTVKQNSIGADGRPWGVGGQGFIGGVYPARLGPVVPAPLIVTHQCDNSEYFYQVQVKGFMFLDNQLRPLIAGDSDGTQQAWAPLYALEFSTRSPWQSRFIDQAHFSEGAQPLPATYVGKTVQELLAVQPALDFTIAAPGPECLAVDNSVELLSHPILDRFVADMGNDPVALANYVLNEIELVDYFAYNLGQTSPWNSPTLNRGAVGVFLEKQGSPAEKCALLVYLLRRAGTPARYAAPPEGGVKLLSTRLSAMTGIQLGGATGKFGDGEVTDVIPVTYPWVTAYIDNRWVHIFPWLQDVEVIEGLGVRDVLPQGYGTAVEWMRKYFERDASIMALHASGASPGRIFLAYLDQRLREDHPGIGRDGVGSTVRVRRHYFSRWEDFPKPLLIESNEENPPERVQFPLDISGAGADEYCTLPGPTILTLNVSCGDTVEKRLFPDLPLGVDEFPAPIFHNRQLIVRSTKTGENQHRLTVSLEPFRPGENGTGNFEPAALDGNGVPIDPYLLKHQERSFDLEEGDENIQVYLALKRFITEGWSNQYYQRVPVGFYYPDIVESSSKIQKGDLAAICLNFGRVTKRMLDLHVRNFQQLQKQVASDPGTTVDDEQYAGAVAYLAGMSYYEQSGREFAELERVSKGRTISAWYAGFSKFTAERDVNGSLPNGGEISLSTPQFDIFGSLLTGIGNQSIHLDAGAELEAATSDVSVWRILSGSAYEHATLNTFFHQEGAISTVRLLELAQERAAAGFPNVPGMVVLTGSNFAGKGEEEYGGVKLKDHDPEIWQTIESYMNDPVPPVVYCTPGAIESNSAQYRGMGALLIGAGIQSALISKKLNGGSADKLQVGILDTGNINGVNLDYNEFGDVVFRLDSPELLGSVMPDFLNPERISDLLQRIAAGEIALSPEQQARLDHWGENLGFQPTGNEAADRAALQELAFEKSGESEPNWFGILQNKISDPVNIQTGAFYLDFVDLTLSGPMPLELRRNYNSQSDATGELGIGWKLSYFPSLTQTLDGEVFFAAEPDGSVIAYERSGNDPEFWLPTPEKNPDLANARGRFIGGLGNPWNGYIHETEEDDDTVFTLYAPDGSQRRYVQRSFASGGIQRLRPYLERWTDNRGNFLNFSYGEISTENDWGKVRRIQASNGNFMGFYYDLYGRLTEAYSGDGRRTYYDYDRFGDLASVSLPDGAVHRYEYLQRTFDVGGQPQLYSEHLLIREIKSNGRILENIYDDANGVFADAQGAPVHDDAITARRVSHQFATVGPQGELRRNATFEYHYTNAATAPPAGYVLVSDAYDRTTRYDLSGGQIVRTEDPEGNVVTRHWFEPEEVADGAYKRSLAWEVDARGLRTEFKYDTRGNIRETRRIGDLTGSGAQVVAVWTAEWNERNQPEEQTDPAGIITRFLYEDANYPYLSTTIEKRTNQGLISKTLREFESVAADGLESHGLLFRETRAADSPDAAQTTWTNNERGLVTARTRFTGTADPNVGHLLFHNLRGELVTITDVLGRSLHYAYDALGRRIWEEVRDETARLIGWNYDYFDGNGDLTWSDGSRYDPEDYVWRRTDGVGRPLEEIRWRSQAKADGSGVEAVPGNELFAQTFFRHNLFGDLEQVVNPRQRLTRMTYDAIGRMRHRYFHEGHTAGSEVIAHEEWEYEPGGLVSNYTNPLNGVTNTLYTSTGRPKSQSRPDGTTSGWRYDLIGRQVRENFSNNTYEITAYDDFARTVTRTLHRADDSVLATSNETFDRRGNRSSITDREQNTWNMSYDGLDRVKQTVGPAATALSAQQTATFGYDASGRVTTVTNGLFEKSVTTRDALGRVESMEIRDAADAVVRKTSYAYSPDHHGMTVTEGTGATAIVSAAMTDISGRLVLTQNADGSYQRNVFDAGGFLTESHDVFDRVTRHTYDGLGRLETTELPDGATTVFERDAAGNMLERRLPSALAGPLKWKASYDSAGRLTSEEVRNGDTVSRAFGYTYYPAGHPWAGSLHTVTDPRGITFTHDYDDFLRKQTVVSDGALAVENQTTTFGYDDLNRLTSVAQNYALTATGPATLVQRGLSAYGQIVSEAVSIGGNAASQLTQRWDAAGRRESLDAAGAALPAPTFAYNHRADGALDLVTAGGQDYIFVSGDNGLPIGQINPFRTAWVDTRDARGRITQRTTTAGASTPLVEEQAWYWNSTLDTYTATRTGSGVWGETRTFWYDDWRGFLTEESYAPADGQSATLNYQFDLGGTSGLGIRTKASVEGGHDLTAAGVTSLGRIVEESTNAAPRAFTATGLALGAQRVDIAVDGLAAGPVTFPGWQDNTGVWSVPMRLAPGEHTLKAVAHHPSGHFQAEAANHFRVLGENQTLGSGYDAAGQTSVRTWAPGGPTQTLDWDAMGRLVGVKERDATAHGSDWTAIYDGLGRRLRTTWLRVAAGVALTSSALTIDSIYDPQVEFLEVAATVNGQRTWKVYGPDLNGTLGGLHGIGGLESTVTEAGVATGIINDLFGHAVASSDGTAVTWNPTKVGSYGPLPEQTAKSLSLSVSLAEATNWRDKRIDPTGFYYNGARYYDPLTGRFLSPDPFGHAASFSLYDYANGDPLNYCDPDGRIASRAGSEMSLAFDTTTSSLFWSGMGGDLKDSAIRIGSGLRETGYVVGDVVMGTVADTAGYGDYYEGNSRLYQDLAAHPENFTEAGLRDSIARGTLRAEAAILTLGGTEIAAGAYQAATTGDFSQLQDASLSTLIPVAAVKGIQGARGLFAAEEGVGPGAALGNSSEFFSRVPKQNTTTMIAGPDGAIDVGATLDRIAAGEKFPHRNDGSIFGNREGLLPSQPQGYYKEYVHPTPGVNGPGPQRIIIGQGGDAYFTADHYGSFIPLNH